MMRIGVFGGMLAVAACAVATAARADQVDDLGRYGKDFKRAVALQEKGDAAGAIEVYQRLIKQHEDVPIPYYFLGNLYWDTHRESEAHKQYAKAKQASPG